MLKENIPWVEKYRPDNLESIVLNPTNRIFLNNIINFNYFPNIIFHGPPGTGKTTTIINLIKKYVISNIGYFNSSLLIHLNASDERGIDVVRHQISTFVGTNNLFVSCDKFVVLDEADYMTKAAQSQLKELIQKTSKTRFCLICNYISKIDFSLKNEFITIPFNKVPDNHIQLFLKKIVKEEKIKVSKDELVNISTKFSPDIRSMINFMQLNFNEINNKFKLLNDEIFEDLIKNMSSFKLFSKKINNICNKFNINFSLLIDKIIMFLLMKYDFLLNNSEFLDQCEFIHKNISFDNDFIEYFYITICSYF